MYAWLPLAEPEARPLRRAMGALLRELDDTPPDDVTDIPELQVKTHCIAKLTCVHNRYACALRNLDEVPTQQQVAVKGFSTLAVTLACAGPAKLAQ